MSYRCILLFGKPGCGKSTLGRALGALPGFVHFSTGEMFRLLEPESKLGKKVTTSTNKGELVPDSPTIKLWSHYIERMIHIGVYNVTDDILVLDGFPINITQAKQMASKLNVVKLIHLIANDEVELSGRMMARGLASGRQDDKNMEVIRKRLDIFMEETIPALEFFDKSLIIEINAMQKSHLVLRDLTDALEYI